MIILNAMAGLCNRLRAINSAIRLAGECKSPLRVYWVRGRDMNTAFGSLFKVPKLFGLKDLESSTFLTKLMFSKYNPLCWDISRADDFMASCRQGGTLPHFFSTYYDFYHNENYSWLKPLPSIQSAIDRLKVLSESAVGVHIRRTDNLHCLRYSPVELFFDRMAHDIDVDGRVRFFVCTDDRQVKLELKRRFGDHVLTRDNVADRAEAKGVIDAVIDLYLLAGTRKIYGSYPSTFSHVAAQIGGIPLEFLKTDEAKNAPYLRT